MEAVTTRAPGRINIIGEHIDYLDGFVLPAAVGCEVQMTVHKNNTKSTINATADDLNESYSFDLASYKPISDGWQNYIMGVFHELEKLGADIKGCDLTFHSTVPIGAGMSSSAALECSLALALNELFELNYSKIHLVKACQMAEHNFVGIKCGIMDQFASIMGRANSALLLDCRSLEYEYYPLELGDYQLLLMNSNVSHELATSAYNDRRSASEEGLAILKSLNPGVDTFRDVTLDLLEAAQTMMNDFIYRRCKHVVSEIQRTLDACDAMKDGNLPKLGQLIYEGHYSLQHNYEVTCDETDFLVEYTKDKDYVLGARQMGGGFGGCTINLIHKHHSERFSAVVDQAYRNIFGKSTTPYVMDIAEGASVIT